MDIFTNRMTELLITRKEDAISALFRDSVEYADLRKTLNRNTAQSVEQVKEDIHRLYMEGDFIYLQGFKDCIRLLQFLEVL